MFEARAHARAGEACVSKGGGKEEAKRSSDLVTLCPRYVYTPVQHFCIYKLVAYIKAKSSRLKIKSCCATRRLCCGMARRGNKGE